MSVDGADRCKEVAAFLRSRRLRLSPQEVGLPSGPRRRVSGLRREEVAYLADIGITWYTWLEQGRPISIASETLGRLSSALRLNDTESAYLSTLLRTHKAGPRHWQDDVPSHIRRLLRAFREPACVVNPRYDVLAWNEPHERTYGFSCTAGLSRNGLWRIFNDGAYQHRFADWTAHARGVMRRFRSRYAEYVGEPLFETLIDGLSNSNPIFEKTWSEIEIAASASATIEILGDSGEHVRYEIVMLPVPEAAGQAVAVHVPTP